MSVQVDGVQSVISKKSELLSTPKKRKHGIDVKESSKKKKKQRTESAAIVLPDTTEAYDQVATSKKKSKRETTQRRDSGDEAATSEPNGIELIQAGAGAGADGSDAQAGTDSEQMVQGLLESEDPTCFYSTRISLCVSVPAISLETAGASLMATHLAPLILTYFPPARGIVLGFSDPVLSAKPGSNINIPLVGPDTGSLQSQAETLARTADEFGVCWVWLTVTLLTFRPEKGDKMHGWTNVTSEGFIGLVSYNYFQTAIARNRIPEGWTWNGPTAEQLRKNRKKGRIGKLASRVEQTEQEPESWLEEAQGGHISGIAGHTMDDVGFFTDDKGSSIGSTLQFGVVDTEIVPAHDRHKWSLQIDGTLLDEEAEQRTLEEERARFERSQQRSQSQASGEGIFDFFMSGGRGVSREGSVVSRISMAAV